MKTKEKHPVYFLRTSDFKPIKGIKELVREEKLFITQAVQEELKSR